MNVSYWWPTSLKNVHEFHKSCGSSQRIKGLRIKSMAKLVITLLKELIMKWGLDLIGQIKLVGRPT